MKAFVALFAFALSLVACGGDVDPAPAPATPGACLSCDASRAGMTCGPYVCQLDGEWALVDGGGAE